MRITSIFSTLIFCFGMITLLPASTVGQEADFFWSMHNLNEGAVNRPIDEEFEQGESSSIYLYYSTNGPSESDLTTGFFLDIESGNSGVIEFVGAETFDFELTVSGTPIGIYRLDSDGIGGAAGSTATVTADAIQGLAAFTILGNGIQSANGGSGVFLDAGYDEFADAYLVARVDFNVIGPPGFITQIRIGSGTGLVVNGSKVLKPTFNCATLRVFDDALCGAFDTGSCEIQSPPTGDVNNDGVTNLLDVSPFVDAIVSGQYVYEADLNQDSSVDLLDVSPFIDLITGDPGEPFPGDVDCNGRLNLLDIQPFIQVLNGGVDTDECSIAMSDVNGDGNVDLLDLAPMINLLLELN